MSKGIMQIAVPIILGILLLLFLQRPIEEIIYERPKPIPIAPSEIGYEEKFCPNGLFGDPASFKINYQNDGNRAGVFIVVVSAENATVKYKNDFEGFREMASKSWRINAGQLQDYNFEINYTRIGKFQDLPSNVNIKADLSCTYEISLPIASLTCEGFTKCCKYSKESFSNKYSLVSETC